MIDCCLICPGPTGTSLAAALQCPRVEPAATLPDAAVVFLLDCEVVDLPGRVLVRLHRSLLPAFRGPRPVLRAMMAGVAETGLCAIRVSASPLAGPVLGFRTVRIRTRETGLALRARLDGMWPSFCSELLERFDAQGIPEGEPQDASAVSAAEPISIAEAEVDWFEMPSTVVFNRIRALSGTETDCWTPHAGERIALRAGQTSPGSGEPGVVTASGPGGIRVATLDGAVRLQRLAGPDGREIPPISFPRRFPVGSRFGALRD